MFIALKASSNKGFNTSLSFAKDMNGHSPLGSPSWVFFPNPLTHSEVLRRRSETLRVEHYPGLPLAMPSTCCTRPPCTVAHCRQHIWRARGNVYARYHMERRSCDTLEQHSGLFHWYEKHFDQTFERDNLA